MHRSACSRAFAAFAGAFCGLLWLAALPGHATAQPRQETPPVLPPAAPPATATPAAVVQPAGPQPYSRLGDLMTFRIAKGDGPAGAARWISATGQIGPETHKQFDAFTKANAVEGLPLVLDSYGGRTGTAMEMGRKIRALKLTTTIGRTVSRGEKDAVRSKDVACASACVLLLMAGAERTVPRDAYVGVHLFSVSLDPDGNKLRDQLIMRDIENAQIGMARHAAYLEDMGISAQLLLLMGQASFKGDMRKLTDDEIAKVRLASLRAPDAPPAGTSEWVLSPIGAPAQMVKTLPLRDDGRAAVDHELIIACNGVRNFLWVTYRQVARKVDPALGGKPVSRLASMRLETGGWDFIFRHPPIPQFTLSKAGGDFWMRRDVPQKVFEDAKTNGRLMAELRAPGASQSVSFFDAGFAGHFEALTKRCDAVPGRMAIGQHPRH